MLSRSLSSGDLDSLQPSPLPFLLAFEGLGYFELHVEADDQGSGGEVESADQRHVDDLTLGEMTQQLRCRVLGHALEGAELESEPAKSLIGRGKIGRNLALLQGRELRVGDAALP